MTALLALVAIGGGLVLMAKSLGVPAPSRPESPTDVIARAMRTNLDQGRTVHSATFSAGGSSVVFDPPPTTFYVSFEQEPQFYGSERR